MQWLGLSALEAGLSLAVFGGAIVLLYLLKQEQRRVVVPAVALWESLLASRQSTTLWKRFRRLISLLLALSIVVLVLLSLADIRRALGERGRNVVILIDRSASMAATDVGPSRLEAAKRAASDFVRALDPADRAIVVALDREATPLSPLSDDRVPLLEAIGEVSQSDLAGDLEVGVRLATDVLAGLPAPEVVLFSDGGLQDVGPAEQWLGARKLRARYVRVGSQARNLAITNFSVRRYPLDKTHHESIVSVASFSDRPERVRLSLRAGDVPLYAETLTLAPRAQVTRALTDLAGGDSALEARLEALDGTDALASDDRAYAALPPRARTRVLLVSGGNRYLEAALLLDEYLELDERTPAAYRDASEHDVVIFDRVLPPAAPGVPALYLGLPAGSAGYTPLALGAEVKRPFFERIERSHPTLRFVALGDVNVARTVRTTTEPGDQVLAATADRVPLIVAGTRAGHRFIALSFDVRESDLPLRPAWPLFLLGAIDDLAGESQLSPGMNLAGEPLIAELPPELTQAELVSASGAREPLRVQDGRVRIVRERAGVYELRAGPLRTSIAINVPASLEAELQPRERVLAQAEAAAFERRSAGIVGERLWPLFALLVLLLLGVEWLTFHRRWTL